MCVNGADKLRIYDGLAWHTDGDGVPYNITNIDTATVSNITLFKNRIWLTTNDSLKVWYLPVNSIGGAAVALDMTSIFQMGGYIVAGMTWTLDAGYGVDDYLVFITSNGEALVWRLTDPTTPSGISQIGLFRVGAPIGRRCYTKFGGDLLIITQDGVVPMAGALQSSRLDPRVSITNKIQYAMGQAGTTYGANFGWQLLYYPKENQLIMNVPIALGQQQQYVMNNITKSWCNFTGCSPTLRVGMLIVGSCLRMILTLAVMDLWRRLGTALWMTLPTSKALPCKVSRITARQPKNNAR